MTIIDVDFKAPQKTPHFVKKESATLGHCGHYLIEVDSHQRLIACRQCGQIIEPFDYVLALANKEIKLFESIAQLEQQRTELAAILARLRKDEKKAKTRLKAYKKPPVSEKTAGFEVKDKKTCLAEIREKLK